MFRLTLVTVIVNFVISTPFYPPIPSGPFINDLFGRTDDFEGLSNLWTVSGLKNGATARVFSDCRSYPLIGGPQNFGPVGYYERTYNNLSSHTVVYYSFEAAFFNTWQPSDTITVSVDGRTLLTWYPQPAFVPINAWKYTCNDGTTIYIYYPISGRIFHTSGSLTFRISYSTGGDSSSSAPGLGIRNVQTSYRPTNAYDTTEDWFISMGISSITGSSMCESDVWWDGSNCNYCDVRCKVCQDGSMNRCYMYNWISSYDGTTGVSCPSDCGICHSSTSGNCIICDTSYALNLDGTCQSSCSSGSTVQTGTDTNGVRLCIPNTCGGSNWMLYNYTCVPSCDGPLVQTTLNSIPFCKYPCDQVANLYLYWNGSCLATCPYYTRIENGYKYCDACQGSSFYYTYNGSCLSTCEDLFTPLIQNTSKFCTYPCSSGQHLYTDGSCHPNCLGGMSTRTEGTAPNIMLFCDYRCLSNEYLYANGSCFSTCDSIMDIRIEPVGKFCDYPCQSNEYLNPNKSCSTSCSNSNSIRIESVGKFCDYPCQSNQYMYANGSCYDYCQKFFIISQEAFGKFCSYPCQSNEYLYPNGLCVDNCASPLNNHQEPTGKFCDYPCSQDLYLYADTTCVDVCPPPTISAVDSNQLKVCTTRTANITALTQSQTAMSQTVAVTAFAVNIVSSKPSAFSLVALADLSTYIKFLNIQYSDTLENIFLGGSSFDGSSGIIFGSAATNIAATTKNKVLPTKFSDYGYYSSFLANCSQNILQLLTLVFLAFISIGLEIITIPNDRIHKISLIARNKLAWDFVIMNCISTLPHMMLAFILETLNINSTYAIGVISLLIAIITILFTFVIIYLIFKLARLRVNLNNKVMPGDATDAVLEDFKKQKENYVSLFHEFVNDNIIQQSFMMIFIIRIMLVTIVVGYMYKYPLAQSILLFIINFASFIYMLFKNPFDGKVNRVVHTLQDGIILLQILFVLVLAGKEHNQTSTANSIESISLGILGTLISITIVNLLSTVIHTSIGVHKFVKKFREERKKKKSKVHTEIKDFPPTPTASKYPTLDPQSSIRKINENNPLLVYEDTPLGRSQSYADKYISTGLLKSGSIAFDLQTNFGRVKNNDEISLVDEDSPNSNLSNSPPSKNLLNVNSTVESVDIRGFQPYNQKGKGNR